MKSFAAKRSRLGAYPLAWIAAGLAVASRVLTPGSLAQEIQTNSPAYHLGLAVKALYSILEPPTNQISRTFSTTLKVIKADSLPAELAGQEVELAFQAPDHLRIRTAWEQQDLVLCRDGQEIWVYAPGRKFGVAGSSDNATASPLGPLSFPITGAQLALLPLFTDVKALPGEAEGGVPCRVLEVTAKPEAVEAIKLPRGTLQLWLRETDSLPVKFAYRDGPGNELQIALVNPQVQPAWAEERWKLKPGPADRIVTPFNYFDNYEPSAPLKIAMDEVTEASKGENERGYKVTRFTFDGFHGETVPALISLPTPIPAGRLPAIIFLHGIGQNKNFLKEITAPFNRAGFAFVSFDQYTQGERKLGEKKSLLAQLEAFIDRPAKTVNETRRLIDYLQSRGDIDPKRTYLVGASYGAVMGSTVLAKDKRVRAGVMVYGGGDLNKLVDSEANRLGLAAALGLIDGRNLNPEKPPLPKLTPSQERQVGMIIGLVKILASRLLGVIDPIRYAGQISPTPVYFQNGTHDVLVPAAAGKALQDAAREPKKITWYESDHVGIDRQQTMQVLEDGLRWLIEQDAPFRAPTNSSSNLK